MVTPNTRAFVQRLLDHETAEGNPPDRLSAVLRVFEKLRRSLSLLAGSEGFRALLTRALTLAKKEAPSLSALEVDADGALAGLREAGSALNKDEISDGGVVLIAKFIGLLVAFIGEGLTVRLVRDVWPEAGEFSKEERNQ